VKLMASSELESPLCEYVPGLIWLKRYPVRYAGCDLFARLSLIRLRDGSLLAHSPCDLDEALVEEIRALGSLRHIVGPGTFHYFHIADWQRAFPEATTWICPGIERKQPQLDFDWILGDRSPPDWEDEIDQVLVRGNRIIWEVAFLHRESRTLILTDLVENIGDSTPGTNWVLQLWWKAVMHMWNVPKPAPEYQLGWKDKAAAKRCLERILEWEIDRVVIAHGENLEQDPKRVLREAWRAPLSFAAPVRG